MKRFHTLVLLLHCQVDLVNTGLDVVPRQVVAALLGSRRLQSHQLVHVPAGGGQVKWVSQCSFLSRSDNNVPIRALSRGARGVWMFLFSFQWGRWISTFTLLFSPRVHRWSFINFVQIWVSVRVQEDLALCVYLWAYSSSTLLSPVTVLDSCFHKAVRSPASIAWFISTTDDSISTATSSSGWVSAPCRNKTYFQPPRTRCWPLCV